MGGGEGVVQEAGTGPTISGTGSPKQSQARSQLPGVLFHHVLRRKQTPCSCHPAPPNTLPRSPHLDPPHLLPPN